MLPSHMETLRLSKSSRALLRGWPLAASATLLFVVMLLGGADVVGTTVLATPVPAAMEIAATLFGVAIFLAWPEAQQRRAHIAVDLFVTRMPLGLKRLSELLGLLCGITFYSFVAWGAIHLAMDSWQAGERAVALIPFPIYPAKIAVAVGAAMTVAVFASQLLALLVVRESDQ